jgi:hypothetical protein
MIPAIEDADATWYFSVVMVWSDTEVSTAIIALSLPALKGLFGGIRNKRKGSSQDGVYGSLTEDSHKMQHLSHFQPGSDGVRHLGDEQPDVGIYEGEPSTKHIISSEVAVHDNDSDEVLWRKDDRIYVNHTVKTNATN